MNSVYTTCVAMLWNGAETNMLIMDIHLKRILIGFFVEAVGVHIQYIVE